jgi:hypothetical protein
MPLLVIIYKGHPCPSLIPTPLTPSSSRYAMCRSSGGTRRPTRQELQHTQYHDLHGSRLERRHTLFEGRKLEPADVLEQLLVRSRLAVLAICASRVEAVVPVVPNGLDDGVRNLLDRHLFVFSHGEDDGRDVVVLAELPDEELGEIPRVNELPERLAGAGNDEWGLVL